VFWNIYVVGDNFVKIWDILSGGRLLMALNSHHKTVTSLCFCMNYKRLVSASLDRLVIADLWINDNKSCIVSNHSWIGAL